MTDFLKAMEENSVTCRDKALFADGCGNILTYGEFYEIAGRVYAYLSQRGVGSEDFVLVCLPRGYEPIVACCGILRAGAAFVMVEDVLPAERIEYIRADCGCKLTIDQSCWQEIQGIAPLDGYEERDAHSAAFAVYTSGTTGAPKGVLHEYGNIALMIAASPLPVGPAIAHFALCSPLNFVLSAMSSLVLVAGGITTIYVVPFATVKDPMKFRSFLVDNAITFSFLSPLFVKKMAQLLSSLTFCVVGAEPANDLFSTDFPILNGYTMSEVGFTVASFLIDKPYPNTPAGNPAFECPIRLVGESGEDVAQGEKGEIVVWNPYVRGYIDLPEKTAAAFESGWYHTGDLGVWDEQGRLVVSGRLDDMAKVNGNRVEPGEIEIVARDVLGLSWVAAKVFNEDEKSFVCLYYLAANCPDGLGADAARAKMAERLPQYMLPQFFVPIDEVPLTAAGKFNRRALKAPVPDDERVVYRAPENDMQRALCTAFAKALNVSAVGLDDDFSLLGGDSVAAMEVVVASGLPGLSVADVLQGRTPGNIAAVYAQRAQQEDPDEVNARAFEKSHDLTADQAYTVELQLSEPESTMRSIHTLQKFNKDVIDMERMAAAIDAAARNHPALMTEIYRDEAGGLRQRFSRDILPPVKLERMTESEFESMQGGLVQPFGMIGEPLFRARVFETDEAGYVFIDVHHAVFDGSSNSILLSDIMAAYVGKDLSKDYYPYLLEMSDRTNATAGGASRASYFEDRYDGVDWCYHLSVIGDAQGSAIGTLRLPLPATAQQLSHVEKSRGLTKNGFFLLSAAMALGLAQGVSDVMVFWSFNGRTDAKELNTVGSLRCYLPLALTLDGTATLGDLCASVHEQIGAGIAHCREPYLELKRGMLDEGITRVLYQGSLGATPKVPGFLGAIPLGRGAEVSRAFVNLEINEVGDECILNTRYTEKSFSADAIDRFTQLTCHAVEVLSEHADDAGMTVDALKDEILRR